MSSAAVTGLRSASSILSSASSQVFRSASHRLAHDVTKGIKKGIEDGLTKRGDTGIFKGTKPFEDKENKPPLAVYDTKHASRLSRVQGAKNALENTASYVAKNSTIHNDYNLLKEMPHGGSKKSKSKSKKTKTKAKSKSKAKK